MSESPQAKTNQLPVQPRTPITSSEVALVGPEYMPVYANFVREISTLPPPHQGGDQGWQP